MGGTEMKREVKLLRLLKEHESLGIASQIDYQKFYLYSLITHSTAIEGSTVTEIEDHRDGSRDPHDAPATAASTAFLVTCLLALASTYFTGVLRKT